MFEITKADDIAILHLYGEISRLEMQKVAALITSLKKHRHHKILIDLANVDHLHFEAVKRWAMEARELQGVNGDLKIVFPNDHTRKMMKFTGADQYLKDYSNVAEALLSFLRAPQEEGLLENESSSGIVVKGRTEVRMH
ncbi:MAG: hypothetical protein Q7T11_06010 [Deltaproteobacteria bacterium]|nr:hypothetical protein [Deltaproteobacteria bacterium]